MTDATQACPSRTRGMELSLFVLGSALFYTGAMIAMKLWGQASTLLMIGVIALLVGAGVWLEIGALQTERLAMVYLLILGVECVAIALASVLWFGESFTMREILCGLLIVAGTALAWS